MDDASVHHDSISFFLLNTRQGTTAKARLSTRPSLALLCLPLPSSLFRPPAVVTEMQGLVSGPLTDGGGLQLTTPASVPLSMGVGETTEGRIQRLISENPVIIFSRPSCCMCHVMRQLLASLGVPPTVIELDAAEMQEVSRAVDSADSGGPSIFIAGAHVGGLESLMGLHLSGGLVVKLREVGASWL